MKIESRTIALMATLTALNLAIGGLVFVLKLPIFLDAIGTILAAVLLGWRAGVVVGVLSFVLAAALINPVYIWFVGTQAVIAIYAFVAARYFGVFRSLWRAIPAGLLLGVVTGIVSAPVIVMVFGGISGSGRDLITAGLMGTGTQIVKAVFLSGVASEPLDKLLQILAAFGVLRALPGRVLNPLRNPTLEKNGLVKPI